MPLKYHDWHKSPPMKTCKITRSDAEAIRSSTEPTKVLAARYKLTTVQINNIRSGRAWK